MKEAVFVAISFLMGLLCIRQIRKYDKYEKEPFRTMLGVTVWGGIWSIVIATLAYEAIHYFGVGDLKNTLGALLVIGPVEEMAKLLALLSGYFIYRKQMNEPVDGMIYMACVALGFSLIENFFYALAPARGHLLFLRLFICTPMHICFSAFMGLSLYIYFKNRRAIGLLFIAIAMASISHGIYDLVIFNGLALIVLALVVKTIVSWTLDLLGYAVAHSPHRVSLKEFITQYPGPPLEEGIECLHCNSIDLKLTYYLDRLRIQKCDQCDHYVVAHDGLTQIFHHFAASFRKLSGSNVFDDKRKVTYATLYKDIQVSKAKNLAAFDLDRLNDTLERVNQAIIRRMEARWWFPNNLRALESGAASFGYKQIASDGGHAFWRWLIYPFSGDKAKTLHALPAKKPLWNWGAFILPELWFLYHELWGVFLFIGGLYLTLAFAGMQGYVHLFTRPMLMVPLLIRVLSGWFGNDIFYVMHGKWPMASWNKAAEKAGHGTSK